MYTHQRNKIKQVSIDGTPAKCTHPPLQHSQICTVCTHITLTSDR